MLLALGEQLSSGLLLQSMIMFRLFHDVNSKFLHVNWIVGKIEILFFSNADSPGERKKKKSVVHVLAFENLTPKCSNFIKL